MAFLTRDPPPITPRITRPSAGNRLKLVSGAGGASAVYQPTTVAVP